MFAMGKVSFAPKNRQKIKPRETAAAHILSVENPVENSIDLPH